MTEIYCEYMHEVCAKIVTKFTAKHFVMLLIRSFSIIAIQSIASSSVTLQLMLLAACEGHKRQKGIQLSNAKEMQQHTHSQLH